MGAGGGEGWVDAVAGVVGCGHGVVVGLGVFGMHF